MISHLSLLSSNEFLRQVKVNLKKITEKSYKFIVYGNAWSNVNVNYNENDKFIADIEFNITFNDKKYSYLF